MTPAAPSSTRSSHHADADPCRGQCEHQQTAGQGQGDRRNLQPARRGGARVGHQRRSYLRLGEPASDFGPVRWTRRLRLQELGRSQNAFTFIQASMPPMPMETGATTLVGFGVSKGRDKVVFGDSAKGEAVLRWPHEGDRAIIRGFVDPAIRKIAGSDVLIDTTGIMPNTWHSLGGANMDVVCDLEGAGQGPEGPVCPRRRPDAG